MVNPTGRIGRGNFTTMISKNTINFVIDTIGQLIKEYIAKDVNAAQMFSIQIDTTQDNTSKDQCSLVLRYLGKNDHIFERLLGMCESFSGTGKGFKDLVCQNSEKCGIDVRKCVGTSTDGAANMIGEYNGFRAWLEKEVPGLVHVWCYAHLLNLVLVDTTSSTLSCSSLFSTLNSIAAFI